MNLLVLPLIAGGVIATSGSPALASCAHPPRQSEYAFTGTVTSVKDDGRLAHVRTDDGQAVVVNGAEEPGTMTSVDRTYQRGARYEFHPINDSSPYRDNACTATHRIGPAGAGAAAPADADNPDDAQAVPAARTWPSGPVLTGLAGAASLLLLGLGGWLVVRHRRHT
ncbi:MAG: hypothetical protein ACRDT4_27445 [Micromonosporaceae bacterium]